MRNKPLLFGKKGRLSGGAYRARALKKLRVPGVAKWSTATNKASPTTSVSGRRYEVAFGLPIHT